MTDTVRTPYPVEGIFTEGEQPTSKKFTVLHQFARNSILELSRLLGPVRGATDSGVSGYQEFAPRSPSLHLDVDSSEIGFNSLWNNNVSISRLLGSAAAINPSVLSNQEFDKTDFTAGWPLPNAKEIQLPFRPTATTASNFDFFGTDAPTVYSNLVGSPALVKQAGDWHVTDDGLLYSYTSLTSSDNTVAYGLKTDQGDTYWNAGYNVIPDPSILRISNADRQTAMGSTDYGACVLTYVGVSGDVAEFSLALPKIISMHESPVTGEAGLSGAEPVGVIESGVPTYTLAGHYSGTVEDNTMYLWDEANKVIVEGCTFEVTDDFNIRIWAPVAQASRLKNDGGVALSTGGSNTKDYFLLLMGTQLSTLVAQLKLTVQDHNHNGYGTPRISHKDLIDASWLRAGINQWISEALFAGGVNVPSRDYTSSDVEDNVHPQYLHRQGYLHGGFAGNHVGVLEGTFIDLIKTLKYEDFNFFEGDLVFGPTREVEESGTLIDSTIPVPDWTHTNSTTPEDLAQSPQHGIVFGLPAWKHATIANYIGAGIGALRAYYESFATNESDTTPMWNTETGMFFGDLTSAQTESNRRRGLNLSWGNLFFGYREDRAGGLFDAPHISSGEHGQANIAAIAGEVNIVVTANGKAGMNTNSPFKGNGRLHDGFTVRAMKGSSAILSVGGFDQDTDALSDQYRAGAAGLEASYNAKKGSLNATAVENASLVLANNTDPRRQAYSGAVSYVAPFANSSFRRLPWQHGGTDTANGGGVTDLFAGWVNASVSVLNYTDDMGGYFWQAALSPRDRDIVAEPEYKLHSSNMESPKNDSGTWGSGLLEATRELNLLVHSIFNLADGAAFANWTKVRPRVDEVDLTLVSWNSDSSLTIPDFGEVKLWGVPGLDAANRAAIGTGLFAEDLYAPAGANLNGMHKAGEDYKRFGMDKPWDADSPFGNLTGSSAPWANARLSNITSPDPSDYGSNIRQMSTVEAFNGFRCDPHQAYVATYRIPFCMSKASTATTGFDWSASEDLSIILSTFESSNIPASDAVWAMSMVENGVTNNGYPMDSIGSPVFLDQLIRYHDMKLSWQHNRLTRPGESISGFSVNLDSYYVSATGTNAITTTPHGGSAGSVFSSIYGGSPTAMMRGVKNYANSGAFDFSIQGFLPVFGSKGNEVETSALTVEGANGYTSTLGLLETNTGAHPNWTDYKLLFNNGNDTTNQYSAAGVVNTNWALVIKVPVINNPHQRMLWPFHILNDGTDPLIHTVSGTVTIDFITQAPWDFNPLS